jgi:hypothetical protein
MIRRRDGRAADVSSVTLLAASVAVVADPQILPYSRAACSEDTYIAA